MKSIAVLGAGWLGIALAKHFVIKGCRVHASTTTATRLPELETCGTRPFIIDINSLNQPLADFFNVDVLVVCIPSKQVDHFKSLIEMINQTGIKKVIYVSSTSVYKNPSSPLLLIETLFQSSDKFKTTVIRFGGLTGPGRNPGRFFRSGKVVRDPDAGVNLIHLDDCIGIIDAVIEKNVWGEVFNGVADTHPSKREFYSHAAKQADMSVPSFSEQQSEIYEPVSNQILKTKLNYQFIHADLMAIDFSKNF